MLSGKNIILGITGGIAAYKAANLTRLLIKAEANVKIIMTPIAKEFITPLTLATLSKNPILVDFYNPENGDWNSHVDLGLWADAFIIAPATANTMGKMANAIADNLLITTYLSARCPVFIAPTMDLDMYKHQANEKNMEALQSFGNMLIEPESGELASGLVGKGRMAEPETIVSFVNDFFANKADFAGKKILITAGPTHEKIDAVRFVGNNSSGKMGFAIAEELASRGALVTLITGPVSLASKHNGITRINVTTAKEMHDECQKYFQEHDVAIMAAAVADYTPKNPLDTKLKKKTDNLVVELEPTKDIAAELGKLKKENQKLIGFALETDNEQVNAKGKLEKKNFDFIVLNSLNDTGAGFQHDTNKITIFTRKGEEIPFELNAKTVVAKKIADQLAKELEQ
ncbi:MAG: bifunctional phosphopantothenoylcysteine decarboxylase/phosphopantothenate--cysteine ligase CoaBC [Salinivirgaceae bacterium]|jgi:phosphopantothenoylcysteine decarboxylase/phosphopantothenate--cysteine ligase|nr:bifunctional phosphopantothenoylcysteine decarboxylase/phosphopantothenate--cysteine ligase CoaBC [Salinivirgaceae bacterium]